MGNGSGPTTTGESGMAIATQQGLGPDHAAPTVSLQVMRATSGTLAVVLVLVGLVAAVVNLGPQAQLAWLRFAGDPAIVLGDGVTLPTSTRTVTVPVVVSPTWTPAGETDRIAAGTGRPVRLLTPAQAQALAPQQFLPSAMASTERVYLTPLGLVDVAPPPGDATQGAPQVVQVYPLPTSPTYATPAARQDLVRRLLVAWGPGRSGPVRVEDGIPGLQNTGRPVVTAYLAADGADGICWGCGRSTGIFRDDGTLQWVTVDAVQVTGHQSATAMSAAEAFERVRHHADGTSSDGSPDSTGGPIVSARLQLFQARSTWSEPDLEWLFLDASGAVVGAAQAVPTP